MTATCFLDVETTGLDPARHEVWAIAMIRRGDDGTSEHQWFIKPVMLRVAEPMALRVGRFYERTAGLKAAGSREKAPKWADPVKLAPLLAGLLDGAVVVGQNPWFDTAFIGRFLASQGHALTADYHLQNLGSLVTGYLKGTGRPVPDSRRLDFLVEALGIDRGADRHTALGDARLNVAVWDAVMDGAR